GFGVGVVTALARLDGHAVGLLVNNPRHLGGAIDGDAADKATAFLRLRKAYGLGAMAMAAGDLRRPAITVAWPTGEFGGMGLEGAVRLGYRKELEAIEDPGARRARYS